MNACPFLAIEMHVSISSDVHMSCILSHDDVLKYSVVLNVRKALQCQDFIRISSHNEN